ncbi:hypothetical protein AWW67_12330 [Roseivirga seohaensis]|uniref:LamG-like jellyroll fold domain-containing protein n=1 Tax=Roseivirga seohaensis TaxID=1914963 RepID=A0A150XN29_9BACT|nr:LamG-like jellyroll fold domain-containing protein [Roseivirga seohaensis]KYG80081.1 hypothetical protein AWW67_12330 [Roseivirga seohaensis]
MVFVRKLIGLFFVCVFPYANTAFGQVNLSNGLIAHYSFNGSALDESGNGHDGQIIGAFLTMDRFDNCEYAYGFQNSPNLISIPNDVLDQAESFSVSLWVKTNQQGVAITAANKSRHNEFFIQIRPENYVYTTVRADPSKVSQGVAGNIKVIDDKWHHVVITRNHVSGNVKIHIDGKLDIDSNRLLAGNPVPKQPLEIAENGLHIGADQDCIGGCWDPNQQFKGAIDDVRFFNRLISNDEIAALKNLDESTVTPLLTLDSVISVCDDFSLLDAGPGFDSYLWSNGEVTQVIRADESGRYNVEAKFNNCSYTKDVDLELNNINLSVTASDSTLTCLNPVTLIASNGFTNYRWSDGQIGQEVQVTAPGEYFVTAVNDCGEVASNKVQINMEESLVLLISASGESIGCSGESIELIASGGFDNYLWSNGANGRIIEVQAAGEYVLSASNSCGEVVSEKITIGKETIGEVFIPNTFTPNGDGKNDFFEIDSKIVGAHLKVVDRWGGVVFSHLDYQNDWYGQGLKDGTYYYLINHPCLDKDIKGWVQIVKSGFK